MVNDILCVNTNIIRGHKIVPVGARQQITKPIFVFVTENPKLFSGFDAQIVISVIDSL